MRACVTILAVLLLCLLFAPAAKADITYDFQAFSFNWNTSGYDPIHFLFTTPNYPTAGSITNYSITTITPSPTCGNVVWAGIDVPTNYLGGSTGVIWSFGAAYGDCGPLGTTVYGFMDHPGVYSNQAPLPTIVTVSGTPATGNQVPEPSSYALLATGLTGVFTAARKKLRH